MSVDGETVHSRGRERIVQSTARLPHERLALNHLLLSWCLSHNDPVCHGRAIPRNEGAISKGAGAAACQWSLCIHVHTLRMVGGERIFPLLVLQRAIARIHATLAWLDEAMNAIEINEGITG